MSVSPPGAAAGQASLTADSLRTLRHELRTPVNHLLGYAELLLEDAPDDGGPWGAQVQRILEAGREVLGSIGGFIESLRDGNDTADAVARIRPLIAEIVDACDVLDAEAERLGAEDAAADLAVIRGAATRLLDLIDAPVAAPSSENGDAPEPRTAELPPNAAHEAGVILVVDDNQQNREMLSRMLARLGHTVEIAAGGREALALMRDRPVDVLLLDVMMPEMDGFEVLARVKADADQRELPVIMLSALDEVASAVHCIEMGADDYLTKPVDTVLLRARIGACLERKRLRDTEVAYLRQAAQVTGPAIIAQALIDDASGHDPSADEASLLEDIDREAEWIDAPKGATLFATGEPGDSMYVVLSGRLRIDEPDERGQPSQCGEVRRGGTIGELEMLTGQSRATTATVVRDARLARIPRDGFHRLASSHPRLLTRTTRDVIDRLRDAFQRRPVTQNVTTFVLLPVGRGVPIADIARDLTQALTVYGDSILVDRQQLPTLLGHEASLYLEEEDGAERLAGRLNELELRHRYVVYEAEPGPSAWTRRCLRQADHVILVGHGRPAGDLAPLASAIERNAQSAPIDLLLLHDETASRPAGTGEWLDRWNVRLHHHLRLGDGPGLGRVVRRLTGTSTDLVLSGGGARGWAHVGVIRAIEEAGIPIDAIGGTSMGGLIGGASLLGMSWRDLQEEAGNWSSPRRLFDFTLPIVSIISGSKITSMLRNVYGDTCIEDLWRGYFCVSSSLTHAQPVVHRRGPLWKAVRASISLPGFLPPVHDDRQLLIDGSYLNNMPTDLMRDLYRSGVVVAVSVDQALEMSGEIDTGPVVSGWSVLRNRLAPWASKTPPPSFAATIMRASSLGGAYRLGASVQLADLAIIPPVERFGTLDFAAYQQIIDVGYEAARRQIDQRQQSGEMTNLLPVDSG